MFNGNTEEGVQGGSNLLCQRFTSWMQATPTPDAVGSKEDVAVERRRWGTWSSLRVRIFSRLRSEVAHRIS